MSGDFHRRIQRRLAKLVAWLDSIGVHVELVLDRSWTVRVVGGDLADQLIAKSELRKRGWIK